MPEMDGIEAAAAIRKKGHKIPIIALTAVENSEYRKNASDAGINEYLVKPVTAESIKNVLIRFFSES